jgi:hypothetical protein
MTPAALLIRTQVITPDEISLELDDEHVVIRCEQ